MADGEVQRREGREGSRWYNAPPEGKDLASWFKDNVEVHEGLESEHYVQGVTLIPGVEKAKTVVGWTAQGAPIIEQRENLVFTPYAKVETRVKYFHDLMAEHEEDWLGVIEPVSTEKQTPGLPPGFFAFRVQEEKGVVNYVCCTMKVTVFKRSTVKWKEYRNTKTGAIERVREGETLIDAPPGTKMVASLGRYGADDFSLMKAETGAVGRALGLAGMLVIPGTGVATAEDMEEAMSAMTAGSRSVVPEDAKPPEEKRAEAAPASEEALLELQQQAIAIITALKEEFPDAFAEFQSWAKERGIGEVAKITDQRKLEGLVRKADRELTNERGKAAKAAEANAPDQS
jgi:hypothetical protein